MEGKEGLTQAITLLDETPVDQFTPALLKIISNCLKGILIKNDTSKDKTTQFYDKLISLGFPIDKIVIDTGRIFYDQHSLSPEIQKAFTEFEQELLCKPTTIQILNDSQIDFLSKKFFLHNTGSIKINRIGFADSMQIMISYTDYRNNESGDFKQEIKD